MKKRTFEKDLESYKQDTDLFPHPSDTRPQKSWLEDYATQLVLSKLPIGVLPTPTTSRQREV